MARRLTLLASIALGCNWPAAAMAQSSAAALAWEPVPASEVIDAAETLAAAASQSRPPASQKEAESLVQGLPPLAADFPAMLRLGMALPTSQVLDEGDLQLTIGQISPTSGGEAGGTGNQNYFGQIDLSLSERWMVSGFYTEADDPLYATIPSREPQPGNLWTSAGGAVRWQALKQDTFRIAIEGSLELWRVSSGGCNGDGCNTTSANIFNTSLDPVTTSNLAGSITVSAGWKPNPKLEISLIPGVSFLPSSQGNSNGRGDFYGTNFFIGSAIAYTPTPQVTAYGSALVPLGPGNNSFDSELVYSKAPIFTAGLRYSLNPRIALDGYITNGFGASPATAILALPSDDRWLVGGRLTYTPSRNDGPPIPVTSEQKRRNFGGLSVANANLIEAGEFRFLAAVDSKASWQTRVDFGFSQLFSFDLAAASVNANANPTSSLALQFLEPGATMLRGGGTALFLSQPRGDAISSALRLSYGRVLGESSRPGYLFAESINSIQLNPNLSLNINPKLASSGSGTPLGLGVGFNWQLKPWLSLIPEGNLATSGGQSNWTLALRACPRETICLDLYGSSALSFMDMGQLLTSGTPAVGVNVGVRF
jgi:hypothetical protein